MGQGNLFDDVIPVLPYRQTSGHSGTDTSKARAEHLDKSGKTAHLQRQVLGVLDKRGSLGVTWRELAEIVNLHHGTVSGALSVLHKDGRIARLKETRGKSKVYVALEFVNGRPMERQGRNKSCPHCGGLL